MTKKDKLDNKIKNGTYSLHLRSMSRVIEIYRDYYWEFYESLTEKVQEKVNFVLEIIISQERIPKKFFKHVEDGIYEIRVEVNSNIYRIFSFFDEGKLVVLLHGFQKKTQKLPRKEIKRAKTLRKNYFDDKEKNKDDK